MIDKCRRILFVRSGIQKLLKIWYNILWYNESVNIVLVRLKFLVRYLFYEVQMKMNNQARSNSAIHTAVSLKLLIF
jgi:hypothetical protein